MMTERRQQRSSRCLERRRRVALIVGFVPCFVALALASCAGATSSEPVDETGTPRPSNSADASNDRLPDSPLDAGSVEPDATEDPDAASSAADADAGADAPAAESGSPDETGAGACNMLVQRGEPVDLAFVVGSRDASQYAGGVIVAGTYALTEATEYVEPSHVGTGPSPYGRETIRITAGTLEVLHDYANGHELRFSAELRSVDGRLEMTPRCVVSNDDALPTLGHWAPLEHETTGFLATSATLTIWTPLGNHASVVRVYARVD